MLTILVTLDPLVTRKGDVVTKDTRGVPTEGSQEGCAGLLKTNHCNPGGLGLDDSRIMDQVGSELGGLVLDPRRDRVGLLVSPTESLVIPGDLDGHTRDSRVLIVESELDSDHVDLSDDHPPDGPGLASHRTPETKVEALVLLTGTDVELLLFWI